MTKLTKSEKEKLKAEALAEYEKKILIPAWKELIVIIKRLLGISE